MRTSRLNRERKHHAHNSKTDMGSATTCRARTAKRKRREAGVGGRHEAGGDEHVGRLGWSGSRREKKEKQRKEKEEGQKKEKEGCAKKANSDSRFSAEGLLTRLLVVGLGKRALVSWVWEVGFGQLGFGSWGTTLSAETQTGTLETASG